MICSLTHDDPINECQGREWDRSIGIILAIGFALTAVAMTLLLARRRRRPS
jgi:hypothetical protein